MTDQLVSDILDDKQPAYLLSNRYLEEGHTPFWAMFHAEMQLSSERGMREIRECIRELEIRKEA